MGTNGPRRIAPWRREVPQARRLFRRALLSQALLPVLLKVKRPRRQAPEAWSIFPIGVDRREHAYAAFSLRKAAPGCIQKVHSTRKNALAGAAHSFSSFRLLVLDELTRLQLAHRSPQLLRSIHHNRPVPGHRLLQRLA